MEQLLKNRVIDKLSTVLHTHDMRFLICTMYFRQMRPFLRLEGSPVDTCHEIVHEACKRELYKELKEVMERLFPEEDFEYIKKYKEEYKY